MHIKLEDILMFVRVSVHYSAYYLQKLTITNLKKIAHTIENKHLGTFYFYF